MGDDSSKESESKESQDKGADPASDLAILPVVPGAEGEVPVPADSSGAEAVAAAPATPSEPGFKRRSLWQSTAESLNYVNGIAQDEAIKCATVTAPQVSLCLLLPLLRLEPCSGSQLHRTACHCYLLAMRSLALP